jgi:hypothetical protein
MYSEQTIQDLFAHPGITTGQLFSACCGVGVLGRNSSFSAFKETYAASLSTYLNAPKDSVEKTIAFKAVNRFTTRNIDFYLNCREKSRLNEIKEFREYYDSRYRGILGSATDEKIESAEYSMYMYQRRGCNLLFPTGHYVEDNENKRAKEYYDNCTDLRPWDAAGRPNETFELCDGISLKAWKIEGKKFKPFPKQKALNFCALSDVFGGYPSNPTWGKWRAPSLVVIPSSVGWKHPDKSDGYVQWWDVLEKSGKVLWYDDYSNHNYPSQGDKLRFVLVQGE